MGVVAGGRRVVRVWSSVSVWSISTGVLLGTSWMVVGAVVAIGPAGMWVGEGVVSFRRCAWTAMSCGRGMASVVPMAWLSAMYAVVGPAVTAVWCCVVT